MLFTPKRIHGYIYRPCRPPKLTKGEMKQIIEFNFKYSYNLQIIKALSQS